MKKKSNLNKFIAVNQPRIPRDNANYVFKALKSGWVSSDGPDVKKFELNVSKLVGRKFAISVANGSAALDIAIQALNLPKGSEIIIPNLTIISSVLPLIRNGLEPVLADCDINDWNMSLDQIKKKTTKKTKCIIATHIYGYPCEIEKINQYAKQKKIFLIEDAAEVFGHCNKKRKYFGSFGDLSTLSFYANKHITTGEGGMILTDNEKLYQKSKSFRNLCFGNGDQRFLHTNIGWNYRMSNIQAALGVSQLKDLKKIIKLKKTVGSNYYKYLKNIKEIYMQPPKLNSKINTYWVVGILNNSIMKTKKLCTMLLRKGIQTRPFFIPMSKQYILRKFIKKDKNLNISENIYKKGFYLPSSINLNPGTIKYICNSLIECIRK